MTIHEGLEKIKQAVTGYFTTLVILLLAAIFGGLWEIALIQSAHKPITISTLPQSTAQMAEQQKVIGSKGGHSYYYSFCGALNRVKASNRVEFPNAAAARAAGYVAAKNCKGVQ